MSEEIERKIPNYDPANLKNWPGIFREISRSISVNMKCCIPVRVDRYDRKKHIALVTPLVKMAINTATGIKYSQRGQFYVRVIRLAASGFTIDIPVSKGDLGYVIAGDRDDSIVAQENTNDAAGADDNGGPQNPSIAMCHEYTFGFLTSTKYGEHAIDESLDDAMFIEKKNGTNVTRLVIKDGEVIVQSDAITMDGELHVTGGITADGSLSTGGNITVVGDLVCDGTIVSHDDVVAGEGDDAISLSDHVHKYILDGDEVGTSGPVPSGQTPTIASIHTAVATISRTGYTTYTYTSTASKTSSPEGSSVHFSFTVSPYGNLPATRRRIRQTVNGITTETGWETIPGTGVAAATGENITIPVGCTYFGVAYAEAATGYTISDPIWS